MSAQDRKRHPLLDTPQSEIPCNRDLGLELIEAEDGVARLAWTPSERSVNGFGVVQGGYVTAAVDAAMAYALASATTQGEMFTTVTLTMTFHRPLAPEATELRAEVVRAGRRTAYVEATATAGERLIASGVSTLLILPPAE